MGREFRGKWLPNEPNGGWCLEKVYIEWKRLTSPDAGVVAKSSSDVHRKLSKIDISPRND